MFGYPKALNKVEAATLAHIQNNATGLKATKTVEKLLSHPTYSPDLTTSEFFLLSERKEILARETFCQNEKVISNTDA